MYEENKKYCIWRKINNLQQKLNIFDIHVIRWKSLKFWKISKKLDILSYLEQKSYPAVHWTASDRRKTNKWHSREHSRSFWARARRNYEAIDTTIPAVAQRLTGIPDMGRLLLAGRRLSGMPWPQPPTTATWCSSFAGGRSRAPGWRFCDKRASDFCWLHAANVYAGWNKIFVFRFHLQDNSSYTMRTAYMEHGNLVHDQLVLVDLL